MNTNDKQEGDQYKYTIVSFPTEKNVDLVPSTWVFEDEGQTFCWYPPSEDYRKINQWLVECAEPQKEWESYVVVILSRSKTLAKGRRRLRRSYTTKDVESTDAESKTESMKPHILPSSAMKKVLQEIPSMPNRSRGSSVLQTVAPKPKKHLKNIFSDIEDDDAEEKKLSNIAIANSPIDMEYMDRKFKELAIQVHSEINSAKRSILYDIDRKISEVKNTIISNGNSGESQKMNLTDAKAQLSVALPIGNLAECLAFDDSLQEKEKRSALMILYRVLVAGEETSKTCIAKIMRATLTKAVEIEFSGTGRKVRGKGKLDFSKTGVFQCLQDAIIEKLNGNSKSDNLAGQVGRWLSGACDREGGRKKRAEDPNGGDRQ